jgi:hypothetical protein
MSRSIDVPVTQFMDSKWRDFVEYNVLRGYMWDIIQGISDINGVSEGGSTLVFG